MTIYTQNEILLYRYLVTSDFKQKVRDMLGLRDHIFFVLNHDEFLWQLFHTGVPNSE